MFAMDGQRWCLVIECTSWSLIDFNLSSFIISMTVDLLTLFWPANCRIDVRFARGPKALSDIILSNILTFNSGVDLGLGRSAYWHYWRTKGWIGVWKSQFMIGTYLVVNTANFVKPIHDFANARYGRGFHFTILFNPFATRLHRTPLNPKLDHFYS